MKKTIIYTILVIASIAFTSCKKEETNIPTATNPGTTRVQPKENVTTSDLSPSTSNDKQTSITFTEKEFDFGTINQGDKVNHFFSFKNTGKNDLIISRAIGSCGCTVPEFPKEPIAPGKTGVMKVTFNSTGKSGKQQKTVSVYANVPTGGVVLTIKANIVVK